MAWGMQWLGGMNSKIKKLLGELESQAVVNRSIKDKLQKEYNKVFNDSKSLSKAISNAESSNQYQFNQYGEIELWYRFSELSEYNDCREYFEAWLSDSHCMNVDWENECLNYPHGNDTIVIQDEHGRDNGIWQGHKLILSEDCYKSEDGEVDEVKRNELIELHMEKTGYYPGVFRVTYHGDVYPVNTQPKKD